MTKVMSGGGGGGDNKRVARTGGARQTCRCLRIERPPIVLL